MTTCARVAAHRPGECRWISGQPYYDVPLREAQPQWLGLLLHKGEHKQAGGGGEGVRAARRGARA
jgi:hypothetical protein